MNKAWIAALSLAFVGAPFAARAEVMAFHAALSTKTEVPPKKTDGMGTADVTYDTATKKLSWTVTYSGLTGPAIMAHFHGPAKAGKNAAVEVPLTGDLASPTKGSATLTAGQEKDLMNGLLYLNFHTQANKAGEIRGQVEKGAASKTG